MTALTQEQAAALAGLTPRRMRQLDRDENPPERTKEGGYPCEAFGAWLKRRHLVGIGIASDGKACDYEAERARLTKAQADKTEYEAAELSGNLIRAEQVIETWTQMAGAMRSRLLSMPQKVAPRARAAVSDEEAAAQVEAEVLEALQELSTDGLPEAARARRERAAADVAPAAAADSESVGGRASPAVGRKRGRRRV